jgi:hypothetical protein
MIFGRGSMANQRKTHVVRAAQPAAPFIQLQVWEPEMAEGALVEELRVRARASQPGGESGLPVAEDPWSFGRVQPTGSCRQHHGDLVGGSFQTGQRSVAPSSERRAAGRAAKGRRCAKPDHACHLQKDAGI